VSDDNTHETIIWEILQRIKYSTDALQQEKSMQVAGVFITTAQQTDQQLQELRQGMTDANTQLGNYIIQIDTSRQNLAQNRNDLANTLSQMDSDIQGAQQTSTQMQTDKNTFYDSATSGISTTTNTLNSLTGLSSQQQMIINPLFGQLSTLQNELNIYNNQAQSNINNFNAKIAGYQQASVKGHQELTQMDNANAQLLTTKQSLQKYQTNIQNTNNQMEQVHQSLKSLAALTPQDVSNPITLENSPVYTPTYNSYVQNLTQEQLNKGINLVSYQTLFPKILLLIVLFFSMIISSFISLNTINGQAHTRVKLVKRYFFPDFLSIFIAAMIVTTISITAVITLGNLLFQLPLLINIVPVGLIMILLIAVFTLLGMFISFMVRVESITMMVITFTLVFLMFISGFLLSPERMSPISAAIAESSPGMLGLSAFNRIVFYSQPIGTVSSSIYALIAWVLVLAALVLVVKKAKRI